MLARCWNGCANSSLTLATADRVIDLSKVIIHRRCQLFRARVCPEEPLYTLRRDQPSASFRINAHGARLPFAPLPSWRRRVRRGSAGRLKPGFVCHAEAGPGIKPGVHSIRLRSTSWPAGRIEMDLLEPRCDSGEACDISSRPQLAGSCRCANTGKLCPTCLQRGTCRAVVAHLQARYGLPSVGNDLGVDIIGNHSDYGEGRPFDLVGLESRERPEQLVGTRRRWRVSSD